MERFLWKCSIGKVPLEIFYGYCIIKTKKKRYFLFRNEQKKEMICCIGGTMGEKNSKGQPLQVFYCGREACASGHFWGPAVRPHYLLHVILTGKGFYTVNNTKYTLQGGDAFFIRPMESHFYQADSKNPWEYAWVGFGGYEAETVLEETVFSKSSVYYGKNENEDMIHKIKDLVAVYEKKESNWLILSGKLMELLGEMRAGKEEKYEGEYLKKALQYVEDHYSYDIKVQDIADWIGIDRTYLYRIFVREIGMSPKVYLTQQRLEHAMRMLCSSNYSISEIAYSCGFCDMVSFHNHFRKKTGMTPGNYRKRNRIRESIT